MWTFDIILDIHNSLIVVFRILMSVNKLFFDMLKSFATSGTEHSTAWSLKPKIIEIRKINTIMLLSDTQSEIT